jgi:PBP1b-binding outer membrane lipoprotein LpoB
MMPWKINTLIASVLIWTSCSMETDNYISVYQTSSEGDKLKKKSKSLRESMTKLK